MELLQPLCVVNVGLAPGDILDVTGIHEQHLEALRLEDLEHRHPVDARRLHRDGRDADGLEPVGERVQITGEAAERPNGIRIAVRRHRHDMKRRTHVEARSMSMHRCQHSRLLLLLLCSHRLPPEKSVEEGWAN